MSFRNGTFQAAGALIACLAASAQAQTWTWVGLGANSRWDYNTGFPFNQYSNWSPASLPSAGANVVFGTAFGSGSPDLNGDRVVGSVGINTFATFNIQPPGRTLTISSGGLSRALGSLGIQTFACDVLIGNNAVWTIDGPENLGYLQINGVLTDAAGTLSLQKNGAGTLVLANANTYDGGTVINDGKLMLINSSGSATGTGAVAVNAGATLAGSGSVGGVTVVAAAGTIAPGTIAQTAAVLTLNNGLILNNNAVLSLDLGTVHDQVKISSGTYNQDSNVVVNVSDAGGLAPGQAYTIINFLGAAPVGVDVADFDLGVTAIAGSFEVTASEVRFRTLSAPAGLTATPASGSQIDLDWDDNPEAGITYSIYRGTSTGFVADVNSRIQTEVASSSYADSGLQDGVTYYYLVTAVDGQGNESAVSNEATAGTLLVDEILYVNDDAPAGGDGTSWSTAFNSLQTALASANAGDQIWVAGGTYVPAGGRGGTFTLKSDVRLYGGFRGLAGQEGDFSFRSLSTNETILSGDIAGQNCYHVVTASSVTGAVVDGFTIAFGQANGSPGAATNHGAGAFIVSASPHFANCTFRDNTGLYGAAAAKEGTGSPTFTNCVFRNNTATNFYGAAVFATDGGTTALRHCTISLNSNASQGAVYVQASSAQLSSCIVWGNTPQAISSVSNSTTTVQYSCIQGGFAGTGNINVDPKFVDPGTGNLHIQPYSNCVEAGNPLLPTDAGDMDGDADMVEVIPFDREGNPRLIGTVPDMGAYEVLAPNPPPASPTGLSASLVTGTQVALNWIDSPEPDLNGYNVYRGTSPGFPVDGSTLIASNLPASQHTDTVVDDGTTYYYAVTASDTGGGESLASPSVALQTRPSQPTGLAATPAGAVQIDLDWADNPEPDIAGYNVYRAIISNVPIDPAHQIATGVPTSSYSDATGLLDGRTYYYRVTALDGAGNESAASATASGTTSNLAGIIYVTTTGPAEGDGSSWSNAFPSLLTALAAAGAGDQVWVAQGTYKPATSNRGVYFQLKNNVEVLGGFPGNPGEEGDLSLRDPETLVTTLSGNINDLNNPFDNTYHVVTGGGTDNSAVLDGFTVADGRASGAPNPNFENFGACIFNWNGSPTIRNCVVTGGGALVGGGVGNLNSSAVFENCTFRNNATGSGGNSGGGMYTESSSVKVINCRFLANSSGQGGGVYNGTNTAGSHYVNCLFSGNGATAGGAVANESLGANTTPAFINCVMIANTASVGGAMFNKYIGAAPTIVNSIIRRNPGGQIANSNGSAGGPTTYSNIQGGHAGTGNIDEDPMFVDADGADNTFGTPDDDVRLQSGSPCINAGDSSAVPAGVTTDLYGTPRILGSAVDMGVHETIAMYRFDYDHDGDVDLTDLDAFQGCASGPAIPHPGDDDCNLSDEDNDGDVDQEDFGQFQRCYGGPDRAPSPDCELIPA
ncbi:MAG: hypothetical protein AMXMBFR13_31580 [Phycisphaerae bacterium]